MYVFSKKKLCTGKTANTEAQTKWDKSNIAYT